MTSRLKRITMAYVIGPQWWYWLCDGSQCDWLCDICQIAVLRLLAFLIPMAQPYHDLTGFVLLFVRSQLKPPYNSEKYAYYYGILLVSNCFSYGFPVCSMSWVIMPCVSLFVLWQYRLAVWGGCARPWNLHVGKHRAYLWCEILYTFWLPEYEPMHHFLSWIF